MDSYVKSGLLKQDRGAFGTQPTMFILPSVNEVEDVMGSVILLLTDPSDCLLQSRNLGVYARSCHLKIISYKLKTILFFFLKNRAVWPGSLIWSK